MVDRIWYSAQHHSLHSLEAFCPDHVLCPPKLPSKHSYSLPGIKEENKQRENQYSPVIQDRSPRDDSHTPTTSPPIHHTYSSSAGSLVMETSHGGDSNQKIEQEAVAGRTQRSVVALHVDIIGNQFWTEHPEILGVDV